VGYVLGVMHVGRDAIEVLDPRLRAVVEWSEAMAVEAHVAGAEHARAVAHLERLGRLEDGAKLSQRLPAALHAALREVLLARGQRGDALDAHKPWLAALSVTSEELARYGYRPSFALDTYLLRQFAADKAVIELEGAARQLAVLDALPAELQHLLLARALRGLTALPDDAAAIDRLLAAGDAGALDTFLFADAEGAPDLGRLFDAVYHARSRAMAARIAEGIARGEGWLVVVGAGHVVGAQGIPAHLRERGYTVRQVDLAREGALAQTP
jgi:hypothetical protein